MKTFKTLLETIVKQESTYKILSKKGKVLGKFPTKKSALKRLRQIEYFKKFG